MIGSLVFNLIIYLAVLSLPLPLAILNLIYPFTLILSNIILFPWFVFIMYHTPSDSGHSFKRLLRYWPRLVIGYMTFIVLYVYLSIFSQVYKQSANRPVVQSFLAFFFSIAKILWSFFFKFVSSLLYPVHYLDWKRYYWYWNYTFHIILYRGLFLSEQSWPTLFVFSLSQIIFEIGSNLFQSTPHYFALKKAIIACFKNNCWHLLSATRLTSATASNNPGYNNSVGDDNGDINNDSMRDDNNSKPASPSDSKRMTEVSDSKLKEMGEVIDNYINYAQSNIADIFSIIVFVIFMCLFIIICELKEMSTIIAQYAVMAVLEFVGFIIGRFLTLKIIQVSWLIDEDFKQRHYKIKKRAVTEWRSIVLYVLHTRKLYSIPYSDGIKAKLSNNEHSKLIKLSAPISYLKIEPALMLQSEQQIQCNLIFKNENLNPRIYLEKNYLFRQIQGKRGRPPKNAPKPTYQWDEHFYHAMSGSTVKVLQVGKHKVFMHSSGERLNKYRISTWVNSTFFLFCFVWKKQNEKITDNKLVFESNNEQQKPLIGLMAGSNRDNPSGIACGYSQHSVHLSSLRASTQLQVKALADWSFQRHRILHGSFCDLPFALESKSLPNIAFLTDDGVLFVKNVWDAKTRGEKIDLKFSGNKVRLPWGTLLWNSHPKVIRIGTDVELLCLDLRIGGKLAHKVLHFDTCSAIGQYKQWIATAGVHGISLYDERMLAVSRPLQKWRRYDFDLFQSGLFTRINIFECRDAHYIMCSGRHHNVILYPFDTRKTNQSSDAIDLTQYMSAFGKMYEALPKMDHAKHHQPSFRNYHKNIIEVSGLDNFVEYDEKEPKLHILHKVNSVHL
ncbi:hypothetical protein RFI_09059 [Reticulomyxa filosa]|uniref:Uncharacterized protein n=1 Tax=Reticulomyxa filosa TaxID=46433 RepID=X6NQT9_RETFI|nr:hypothetical protein RFI_09059 [Reticulomyxa filosa]|eukprot:ETO28074.1 hypothetical protein RFI_09059 [Reticulomyxa filosa]